MKITKSQGREIGVLIALLANEVHLRRRNRRDRNIIRVGQKAVALDPKYQAVADRINRINAG